MHDPMTVAFDIRWPFTRAKYKPSVITIWHVDPESDGTDDSCGWFKRARHGDKVVLERIVKRFELDWDKVYDLDGGRKSPVGMFSPDGQPRFSVPGVVLNLFFLAACEVFGSNGHTNWRRARRFMSKHLFDILRFAENTTDSLFDGITRKYELMCHEEYTTRSRDERIRSIAGCIYAWIMRAEQRWWQHPRWHVHHWKIQIHPLQSFKRWAFSRCEKCGGRFRWGESAVSNSWHGTGPRWFQSEPGISHCDCSGRRVAATEVKAVSA